MSPFGTRARNHHHHHRHHHQLILFVLSLLCWLQSQPHLFVAARRRKDGNPQSRGIGILNRAGAKFDCYWIHPNTGELSESQTEGAGVVPGGETAISSYIGHSFECQELPRKSTGTCLSVVCQKCTLTVTSNEDQMFTVGPGFVVTVEDHKTRARQKAAESIALCSAEAVPSEDLDPAEQIDRLADCMQKQVELAMEKTDEEIDFQANIRKQLGESWVHYACDDKNLTTTTPIANKTWSFTDTSAASASRRYSRHEVNIYFESDASRLQRAQGVISQQECAALKDSATVLSTSTTPLGSNYGLHKDLRDQNKLIDLTVTKIEAFVKEVTDMLASMSNKNPMLELRIVSAAAAAEDDEKEQEQEECEVQADGSTCAATTTSTAVQEPSPSSIVPRLKVKVENDKVVATVLVVCEAPAEGGQIYFPKTGTVLLPSDMVGSVIVLLHEIKGIREEDPFIDEYLICPVKQGQMVTAADNLAR